MMATSFGEREHGKPTWRGPASASGTHAVALVNKGFAADVAACAKLDVSRCVPLYAEGVISAA